MYAHQEERLIEKVCYKTNHIDKVIESINNTFKKYFDKFIMLEAGSIASEEEIKRLAEKFGVENVKIKRNMINKNRNKFIFILI